METTTVKLYSLRYGEAKTYLFALLFAVGDIALPQLCHTVEMGGPTWLPIYFFTLVGAYKYGWRVGLLTAVVSPVVNSVLFGMPAPAALPAIMLKSILLAGIAGYAAYRFKRVSIILMLAVVLAYQVAGTLVRLGHLDRRPADGGFACFRAFAACALGHARTDAGIVPAELRQGADPLGDQPHRPVDKQDKEQDGDDASGDQNNQVADVQGFAASSDLAAL